MARKFCARVQAYDYMRGQHNVYEQALYATSMECLQRRVDAAVSRELDRASEVVVEYFKYSKSKKAWTRLKITHDTVSSFPRIGSGNSGVSQKEVSHV